MLHSQYVKVRKIYCLWHSSSFSLSFFLSLSLCLPLLLRINDAYIVITCSHYKIQELQKDEKRCSIKWEIKNHTIRYFWPLCLVHIQCAWERERERLANAHVFVWMVMFSHNKSLRLSNPNSFSLFSLLLYWVCCSKSLWISSALGFLFFFFYWFLFLCLTHFVHFANVLFS